MADPLRHRQTKGAATDMVDLRPPRHIPTLPRAAVVARLMVRPVCPQLRQRRVRPAVTLGVVSRHPFLPRVTPETVGRRASRVSNGKQSGPRIGMEKGPLTGVG